MYEHLEEECTDEEGMTTTDLERARAALKAYYDENYPARSGPVVTQPVAAAHALSTTAFDFTSRYTQKSRGMVDELDEFWKRQPEDWSIDPIEWWSARRKQYPRLSSMALDILSIPGEWWVE
jgi:hypothetical protein